jgi:hypothetical protein
MAFSIRRIEYFHSAVEDQPGEAYKLLSMLRDLGVNLLAFTAVPCGPTRTLLTLFPEDSSRLKSAVARSGMTLDGPHKAILVQGDDELGALADVHRRLYEAGVNVASSNAVTDGRGSYGYIIYVRPEEHDKAAAALQV